MKLFSLFVAFFQTGLFAVGGGLATLPFLYDMADATGWFTHADIANLIAVAESTPGAIGVNAATYVGYLTHGVLGGLIATLGLVAPSIIVIILVSRVLEIFADHPLVKNGFYGLRPASTALIATAGVTVARGVFFVAGEGFALDWHNVVLAGLLWCAMRKWDKLHPVVFLGLSAVAGIGLYLLGSA